MKNLKVELFPGFVLDHPIGVSSCHFSGNEKSLDFIISQKPSFITLKSTSDNFGGDGIGNRSLQRLDKIGIPMSFASDGPRGLELLSIKRTFELIKFVKGRDSKIPLGVSFIYSNNIKNYLAVFEDANIDYIEINFKYFMRDEFALFNDDPITYAEKYLNLIVESISMKLLDTRLPLILKLSRDSFGITSRYFLKKLEAASVGKKIGLIMANTSRVLLPNRLSEFSLSEKGRLSDLKNRVKYQALSGASLYPGTLNMVYNSSLNSKLPIIASGGIIDGYHAIQAMMFGAKAIQICSAFHKFKNDCVKRLKLDISDFLSKENLEISDLRKQIIVDDPISYEP